MKWTARRKRFASQANIDIWRAVALPRLQALADGGFNGAREEHNRLSWHPGAVPTAKWREAFRQFLPVT